MSVRLSWREARAAPAYTISVFDGLRKQALSRGTLEGDPVDWARFLSAARYWHAMQPAGETEPGELMRKLLVETGNLHMLARDLASAMEQISPPQGSGDFVLPIYARSDWHLSVERWSWLVYAATQSTPGPYRPVEVVTVPPGRQSGADCGPYIDLPVIVACPEHLALALADTRWYWKDATITRYALRLQASPSPVPDADGAQIVIADAGQPGSQRQFAGWLRTDERAGKLRILVNAAPGLEIARRQASGVATIRLTQGRGDATARVSDLLEAMIHNHPLHQMVFMARPAASRNDDTALTTRIADWSNSPRLYAAPELNHWFQLSPANDKLDKEVAAALAVEADGAARILAGQLGTQVPVDDAERLQTQSQDLGNARDQLKSTQQRGIDFRRERTGLLPMAQLIADREALQDKRQQWQSGLQALLHRPGVAQAVEAAQERYVDAALSQWQANGELVAVQRDRSLAYGASVRLAVHIGQRGPASLMVGNAPALDSLLPPLPDDQAHTLDIVVFPKDFTLEPGEPALKSIQLGRFGGTIPLTWKLRVPLRTGAAPTAAAQRLQDSSRGLGWVTDTVAELRFAVYLGNQLLQSFKLTAALDEHGREVDNAVLIECDFSQTRNFALLERFEPRTLSLALNRDTNNTHTLMIKRATAGGLGVPETRSFVWPETLLVKFVAAARNTLLNAMFENNRSKFDIDDATLTVSATQEAAFEAAVRQMAKAGNILYTILCSNGSSSNPDGGDADSSDLFKILRLADGDIVQVVLHDTSYALPWGLLYDYRLPPVAPGVALPVCRGEVNGQRCACTSEPAGICLRGFWGFRLMVEQLTSALPHAQRNDCSILVGPELAPSTLGHICTVRQDAFLGQFPWNPGINPRFDCADLGTGQVLASLQASRPAVVLYIGHQGDGGIAGAPMPILLAPDGKPILSVDDINYHRQNHGRWEAQRPLVLLMGCGTATARPDTGLSLSGALVRLGATGVVGTECNVATPIVARVTRDLIRRLANGEFIGPALKEIIWELALEGCPVGLAFSYLGPVKARVAV